jgi:hypothetical protein
MASMTPSYSSLKDEECSSFSTLLGDVDLENDEAKLFLDTKQHGKPPKTFNTTWKCLIAMLILLPWVLLPLLYQIGHHAGAKVFPRLPTHGTSATLNLPLTAREFGYANNVHR